MTGSEFLGIGAKAWGWTKGTLLFLRRIATLEARVTALEDALGSQPADCCKACGVRAMRMTGKSMLLGNQGTQWWEEYWACENCGKSITTHHKL
jgi:hypothetical protein